MFSMSVCLSVCLSVCPSVCPCPCPCPLFFHQPVLPLAPFHVESSPLPFSLSLTGSYRFAGSLCINTIYTHTYINTYLSFLEKSVRIINVYIKMCIYMCVYLSAVKLVRGQRFCVFQKSMSGTHLHRECRKCFRDVVLPQCFVAFFCLKFSKWTRRWSGPRPK